MLRTPLIRTLSLGSPTRVVALAVQRTQSTNVAKAPEKIEVFVDDKSVLVDPGTTVLQVCTQCYVLFKLYFKINLNLGCCSSWC